MSGYLPNGGAVVVDDDAGAQGVVLAREAPTVLVEGAAEAAASVPSGRVERNGLLELHRRECLRRVVTHGPRLHDRTPFVSLVGGVGSDWRRPSESGRKSH